ncbi:MAG: hypothetical protein GY862_35600 [Gammaproteobacteria bacterium]|nr:hypothetical protein [Gammaproteobacteria bacterium]
MATIATKSHIFQFSKTPASQAKQDSACPKPVDHLDMTQEKLDHAVDASKHILKDAARGKLPDYV